jgi:hypothetical protein
MKLRNILALIIVSSLLPCPLSTAQNRSSDDEKARVKEDIVKQEAPSFSLSLKKIMEQAEKNIQKVNDELTARKNEEKARQSFEEGNRFYRAGDLDGAKKAWQKALDVTEDPSMRDHIRKAEKEAAEKRRQQEIAERKKQRELAAQKREQERAAKKAQRQQEIAERKKQQELAAQKREQERAAKKAQRQQEIAERKKQQELAAQKREQERAAKKAQRQQEIAERKKQRELAAQKREQERAAKKAQRQQEIAERKKQRELAAQKREQERAAKKAQRQQEIAARETMRQAELVRKQKERTLEKQEHGQKTSASTAPSPTTNFAKGSSSNISDIYNEAVKLYEKKDYMGAMKKFQQVREEDPSYSRVNFYINSCGYILANEAK